MSHNVITPEPRRVAVDEPDAVLRDLRAWNVAVAIGFGIAVGQLAIQDVLLGGRLNILGAKRTA